MLFLRTTIAAAILALALAFMPGAASAKTRVHVGVGIGGWGWGGGCWNWRHGGCGWGAYPRRYYRPRVVYYGGYYGGNYGYGSGYYGGYAYRPAVSYGCGTAKAMVRRNGYVKVSTTSCGGKYHVFKARRNGHTYKLRVNSRSGRIAVVARR